MSLSKITLTLGKGKTKQKINLTPEQFEELKQDMRDLDKSHNYYWHRNPWYQPYYIACTSNTFDTVASSSCVSETYVNSITDTASVNLITKPQPQPPRFSGCILSTA